MSARKSNKKSVQVETKEEVMNTETQVEVVEQQPEITAEQQAQLDEQAETDRLNRVNDIEKEIIQLQDRIKELRAEHRKLEKKPKTDGPSKMDRATTYWKENPGKTRKEYVEAFQKELGLTLAGARTYIQIIMTKNK